MAKVTQRSFAGGVMSEHMMARSDDVKFQSGLKRCENFIVRPQGPVENRPGFVYVASTKYNDRKTRLIKFEFSSDQTMILEMGHQYFRFHTGGKTLMGDNGQPYEVATPYHEDDIFNIKCVQSSDVMTFTHSSYPIKELRRYSSVDWRLVEVDFNPKLTAPTNVKATKTSTAKDDPNEDKYVWKYRVTAMNSDKTAESLPSEVANVNANLYATGTVVTISWDKVEGATFYRVYKNQAGVFGYIGDTEELSITDENFAPEMDITPRRFEEAFGASNGIKTATVESQGSGYVQYKNGLGDYVGDFYPTKMALMKNYKPDAEVKTNNVSVSKYFPQLSWTYAKTSEYNYPDYPKPDTAAINRDYIKIVDSNLAGSGAKVEGIFYEYRSRYTTYYTSGDSDYTVYHSETKVTLIGLKVTARGSSYLLPQVTVQGSDSPYCKAWFDMPVVNTGVTIDVQDETGSGAVLSAEVNGGKLTGVRIVQGGHNYKSPVAVVRSTEGSGAKINLSVGKTGSYPSTVCYHEQRRCFAGLSNAPQRVLMTRSGTEDDMTFSLPVQADDRINIQLASRDNNPILHLVPMGNLLILTTAGEWRVQTMNSDALTPESISVRQSSFVGANNVQPIVANNSMLFCAARGGHVMEMGYSNEAGGYISSDISIRAADLFDKWQITDATFSKAPIPICWFVSTSGQLLGLTYIPHQQVAAWHSHTTDGAFESCEAVAEGAEDVLYCVVRREVNGNVIRQIERLSERSKGVFVDSAGVYEGEETDVITGLSRLEGKTVSVLADGAVENDKVVVNGQIELDRPASKVIVGLRYGSTLETLPMAITLKDNSVANGRHKNVTDVWLRVVNTSGVWVGPDEEMLVEAKQRTNEPYGTPPKPVTGEMGVKLLPKWTDGGEIVVRQLDPLPITIVGLTADVAVG